MKRKLSISIVFVLCVLLGTAGSALALVGDINTDNGLPDPLRGSVPALGSSNSAGPLAGGWVAVNGATQFGFIMNVTDMAADDERSFGVMFDCNNSGVPGDSADDLGVFYQPASDATIWLTGSFGGGVIDVNTVYGEVISASKLVEAKVTEAQFDTAAATPGKYAACMGTSNPGRKIQFAILNPTFDGFTDQSAVITMDPATPVTLAAYGEQPRPAPWLALASAALLVLAAGLAFWLRRSSQSL